ncbi:hypothetical protein [Hymenobacter sp. APR13]|uniref:hypothetical protein n=1 Tax=Hymenobacter sp. APR13 TaxID=1356852 RepID=UPI0004E0418F|nr:hypothetical protein [Hymenobacter sp. APR13]AII51874.1 hypothetical protein N008_07745 [Hymenobacter sp. APR13]
MKTALLFSLMLLLPLPELRAQHSVIRYEQAALDFFVENVLPQYQFDLAFCGKTDSRASQFQHLPPCFTADGYSVRDQLAGAAAAATPRQSMSLTWTSSRLKRGCTVRKHRPLLVVFSATQLAEEWFVRVAVGGKHGATHYMFALSGAGQVTRWCRVAESF